MKKINKGLGVSKESFLHFLAVDSVNKYDSNLEISSGAIANMLKKQNFETKIKQMGYELSKDGKVMALIAFLVDGKPYVEYGEVQDYLEEFGVLKYMSIWTKTYLYDERNIASYRKILTWRIGENGKVVRSSDFIKLGTGNTVELPLIEDEMEYPYGFIPATIIRNNVLNKPDVPMEVRGLLDNWENFMSQVPTEWEKVKTIFANNVSFNSTLPAEQLESLIVKEGKSFVDLDDVDGKLANAISPISLGVATMQELKGNIGFLESKILEYSHQFRDHAHGVASSPNQTDIALFNQRAFEYMRSKIQFREEQLNNFMVVLGRMTGNKTPTIKVNLPDFEQWRIDILESQRDLNVGQAEQALAIATKNKAEAKALDSSRKLKEEAGNAGGVPESTTGSPISNSENTSEPVKEIEKEVNNG